MIFITILLIFSIVIFLAFYTILQLPSRRTKKTIAFFHLYCSSGGGGERVLWHSIEALLKEYPDYVIYIYSHKSTQDDTLSILTKVRDLFKIDLITECNFVERINFIPLSYSFLIEAKRYPVLTLLFQNIGSILVAIEAAYRMVPEVYIETIGFTFTLPIFKLHRCNVITYVHYPTISYDMIGNVRTSSHASFNNREIFVRYPMLRNAKLIYYRALAYLYGLAGRQSDLVMVNSSWTQGHINSLWKIEAHVVYPPCDVESFKALNSRRSRGDSLGLNVVSIAQFRPEKNHQMQIEAFDSFLGKTSAYDSKLSLYGGCRDDEDKQRVRDLKEFVRQLDLESNVEIMVGASFERLLNGMSCADVAIHTMENEHFGIVLLECMAAGLIIVAHNSGGPKTDIIDDNVNGFLANDVEDFASKLVDISRMSLERRQAIRLSAIEKSNQFSTKVFQDKFIQLVGEYLKKDVK